MRNDCDVAQVVAGGDVGGELSGAGGHAGRLHGYLGKRRSYGSYILLPASFPTQRPGWPPRERAPRPGTGKPRAADTVPPWTALGGLFTDNPGSVSPLR